MRRPVAVLAIGNDQGVFVAPLREGFAIFEPGLTIADLFAHHLYVHISIILLVEKAPLRVSRQDFELLKEMQGEGRQEDMVVLFLAPGGLDILAGDEPSLLVQIDIFPFGLKQFTDPTQRS